MDRTLIIERDPSVQSLLTQCLKKIGFEAVPTADASGALEILKQDTCFQFILSGIMYPQTDDFQFLDELMMRYPTIPVIVCSVYTQSGMVEMVQEKGVLFLQKPFTLGQLSDIIDMSLLC